MEDGERSETQLPGQVLGGQQIFVEERDILTEFELFVQLMAEG